MSINITLDPGTIIRSCDIGDRLVIEFDGKYNIIFSGVAIGISSDNKYCLCNKSETGIRWDISKMNNNYSLGHNENNGFVVRYNYNSQ